MGTEQVEAEVRYFRQEGFSLAKADVQAVESAVTLARQGDYDVTAVQASVKTAGARNRRTKRDAAVARVAMAAAVFAAVESGQVGKGQTWDTRADLATALDVTGGTITGLHTLGLAIHKGFGPDAGRWSVLSSKAGRKEVREAVEKAENAAQIDDALGRLFTPDGKPNAPQGPRSAGGATPDGDKVVTDPAMPDPMERIGEALATIAELAVDLSREDFALVEDRMSTVWSAVVGKRAAAAKAARKGKAA